MAGESLPLRAPPSAGRRAFQLPNDDKPLPEKAPGWGEGLTILAISGVTTGQEPSQKGRDVIIASRDKISMRAEEGGGDAYIGSAHRYRRTLIYRVANHLSEVVLHL